MYCSKCGHENDDQAKFCASCGIEQQPSMEEPDIQIDSTSVANLQYAGLLRRFGAAVIDGIIVYSASMVLYILSLIIAGAITSDEGTGWGIVIIAVIVILILNLAYYSVMESSSNQATLGKMALHIIVTDREGNRISFGMAILRIILKVISAAPYGALLLVSCFTIVLTREKLALHDMISGCRVVMKT